MPLAVLVPLTALLVVAVLALTIGIGSLVTVYRIGDSGAKAVWSTRL